MRSQPIHFHIGQALNWGPVVSSCHDWNIYIYIISKNHRGFKDKYLRLPLNKAWRMKQMAQECIVRILYRSSWDDMVTELYKC